MQWDCVGLDTDTEGPAVGDAGRNDRDGGGGGEGVADWEGKVGLRYGTYIRW